MRGCGLRPPPRHAVSCVDKPDGRADRCRMTVIPHPRFLLFLLSFVLLTAGIGSAQPAETALILGFDGATAVFILSCLPLWLETDAKAASDRAARDDGGWVLLLIVTLVSLLAVLVALVRILQGPATLSGGEVVAVVLTLGSAWTFINLVFAFHYSHMYYDQETDGQAFGLGFPGKQKPVFSDFCYFSFTIGMTCQTSDVALETATMRRSATLHGIASYLFNLGVLAMVVNVLAGVI